MTSHELFLSAVSPRKKPPFNGRRNGKVQESAVWAAFRVFDKNGAADPTL
jgi:hypothetical protein